MLSLRGRVMTRRPPRRPPPWSRASGRNGHSGRAGLAVTADAALCPQACNNTSDRKHADSVLEKYVTEIVMSIVTTFFSSPFSDQSTTLQVRHAHLGPEPATGLGRLRRALGTGPGTWHMSSLTGPLCLGTEHPGVAASPSGSLCPVLCGHPVAVWDGREARIREDFPKEAVRRVCLPGGLSAQSTDSGRQSAPTSTLAHHRFVVLLDACFQPRWAFEFLLWR